jgi:hypothetical protein
LAKKLNERLNRKYAVRLWSKYVIDTQQKRHRNHVARLFLLARHVKYWRVFTMRALSSIRAEEHWQRTAKRMAVRLLQRSAQERIASRGKTRVAEDHRMFSVMNATMLTWMDHIREAQEFRGKWKSFGFFFVGQHKIDFFTFHFSLSLFSFVSCQENSTKQLNITTYL